MYRDEASFSAGPQAKLKEAIEAPAPKSAVDASSAEPTGHNGFRHDWRDLDHLANQFGLDKHTSPEILYRLRDFSKTLVAGKAMACEKGDAIREEMQALKKQALDEANNRHRAHHSRWTDRAFDDDERGCVAGLGYD